MQWSSRVIGVQANQIQTLKAQLLALGSLEWEVCGMAASDPTLGLDSIVVTLKRPAPSDLPAAGSALSVRRVRSVAPSATQRTRRPSRRAK